MRFVGFLLVAVFCEEYDFAMKKKWLLLLVIVLGVGIYFLLPFVVQRSEVPVLSEEDVLSKLGGDFEDVDSNFIPVFTEVAVDFVHQPQDKSEAFTGSALIDVNGDGVEEVYVGGGAGQHDALLQFDGEGFVNVASEWGIGKEVLGEHTLGVVSVDADSDEDSDLYVARPSGIYYLENLGGSFVGERLDVAFGDKAMPFSLATTDLNADGLVDLYVSTFIRPQYFKSATFNDPGHVTENVLLMNDGEAFVDVSEEYGIDFAQNTFLSAFVDLNGDNVLDFVSATNTDRVKIYRGAEDGFEDIGELGDYGFWMGLTVADFDGDRDMDLFFTNIGNTVPVGTASGDLRADQVLDPEWSLYRNDGNFQFVQVNEEFGVTGYEFAWGADAADFNLDGREDLVVVENYIKWPAHKFNKLPGRFLLQGNDGVFLPVGNLAGLVNDHYGMTPLISDFNADGYPDIVYVNYDGPARAYLNAGGENHYVAVQVPDHVEYLGAEVAVSFADRSLVQQVVSSTGLLSDQSSWLYFGLGAYDGDVMVEVEMLNGEKESFDVEADSVLEI